MPAHLVRARSLPDRDDLTIENELLASPNSRQMKVDNWLDLPPMRRSMTPVRSSPARAERFHIRFFTSRGASLAENRRVIKYQRSLLPVASPVSVARRRIRWFNQTMKKRSRELRGGKDSHGCGEAGLGIARDYRLCTQHLTT